MNARSILITLVLALATVTANAQHEPSGKYTGQICFRHCAFFKLNIRENGTFELQSKGYRGSWRTSYGVWFISNNLITLKTIDSSSGSVSVSKYILRDDGLWSFDETTKEPIEIVFKARRIRLIKNE